MRARRDYASMPEKRKVAMKQQTGRYLVDHTEKRKVGMKKKKVRYIAVDTEKGAKTSPKAKKTVMIYDTQTQKIATNTAYDVEKSPSPGSTTKIDNYSAEYVGSGL